MSTSRTLPLKGDLLLAKRRKGKGVGTWATFMLTAASLLQPALSFAYTQPTMPMQCSPCVSCLSASSHQEQSNLFSLDALSDSPSWNVFEPSNQMFCSDMTIKESCTEMFYDCFENECELRNHDRLTQIPAQVTNESRVFHIYHLRAFLNEQNETNTY